MQSDNKCNKKTKASSKLAQKGKKLNISIMCCLHISFKSFDMFSCDTVSTKISRNFQIFEEKNRNFAFFVC